MKIISGSFSLLMLLLLFWVNLLVMPAASQSGKKSELENKKKALQKEIDYKNKLLKEVKNSKSKSLIQLAILNNKLKDQEELISTINKEVMLLSAQIEKIRTDLKEQESNLTKLKNEYAKLIYLSYKNKDAYGRLVFIFSANDFNQAYQRLKYFQIYSDFRKKQAEEIETKKKELNQTLVLLEQKKNEQHSLLNEKESEKEILGSEKKEKEELLTDLQQKEKTLKDEVRAKKQQQDKIKKMIDKLIEEEIKKQSELVKKSKGGNKPKKDNVPTTISLTPEEELVSKNFEGNQGKLPWPLSQGVITERFGIHQHPELKGIEVSSNGVGLATNKGAIVRAIFEGEVTAVAEVGGVDGKVILIRHGEYLSVYYTLENVYVKTGDKVKTKQEIGKVMTDDAGKTRLTLEIYKGKMLLDPENWIARKN